MGEVISRHLKRLSTVLSILIGAILLLSIYAWAQVNVMHEEYASIFGYSVFDVVTGSMSGTIEIDDYVVVKRTNDIELNDIVTFKYGDVLITHRVVQIAGDKLITKGDVNNSEDYAITMDNIIGKVVKVIPRAGIWKDVLTKPSVLSCIFITLICFAFFFSFEEKRYIEVRIKGNMALLTKPKRKKVVKAKIDSSFFSLGKKKKEEVVETKPVKTVAPKKPVVKTEVVKTAPKKPSAKTVAEIKAARAKKVAENTKDLKAALSKAKSKPVSAKNKLARKLDSIAKNR